jgi:hypothetical protein
MRVFFRLDWYAVAAFKLYHIKDCFVVQLTTLNLKNITMMMLEVKDRFSVPGMRHRSWRKGMQR